MTKTIARQGVSVGDMHKRQHGHHVTDQEAKEMGWLKTLSNPQNDMFALLGTARAMLSIGLKNANCYV